MKRTFSLILSLPLVVTIFLSNGSLAQNYVHYATLTGNILHRGHTLGVESLAFSPDGRTLASGGFREVILWDVTKGHHKVTLIGHTSSAENVVFSPDGRTLASSGATLDDSIYLWDAISGVHLKTLREDPPIGVSSLTFSPDGRMLAAGGSSAEGYPNPGIIILWDAATGQHRKTLTGHTLGVYSLAFDPNSRILASKSNDDTIRLWDVNTGQHKKTLKFTGSDSTDVVFSPDGYTLAGWAYYVDNIYLWNPGTGAHLQTLIGHTNEVHSVVFSPDGRVLASASDGMIRLWRVSNPPLVYPNPPTPPKSTAKQVYNNAIRAVMWIVNPGIGEGSGALIDKKFKLAVTNAHVTGEQNTVDVYFPAPDENGELIKDRNFYLTSKGVLKRLGYYTKGHVVARDEKTDLAIIKLEGLPETAREINWNSTTPTTNAGDLVYILGNPGGQDLWRWTLGEFLNDHGDFLHIQSDVFGGNSGGPVLNKQGTLIGIVARSDRHMNALAIPMRDINRLLSQSQLKHSRYYR